MRLKALRKKKGISQLRLATDLNTTQNTISRYETGEREPGIAELIKIADYFNVSVDYLIGNEAFADTNINDEELAMIKALRQADERAWQDARALLELHKVIE